MTTTSYSSYLGDRLADHLNTTTATSTFTITATTPFNSTTSAAEESGENDSGEPTKKGLIKKLETDLFLYFLERKESPTLPPLTALPPSLQSTPTTIPSIPCITTSTTKNTNSNDTPVLPTPPLLLGSPSQFNSKISNGTTASSTLLTSPPGPASKAPISVTQLINSDELQIDHSPLFAQWQSKPGKVAPFGNTAVHWNGNREAIINSTSRSPQQDLIPSSSHHSPLNSLPYSSQKSQPVPFTAKFDFDTPAHEYTLAQQFAPSSKSCNSSGRPPSPVLNKQPHYGSPSHMLPPQPYLSSHNAQQKISNSPISWQYEQPPPSQSPFQYSSTAQYPLYPSQYPPHPSYHFSPSPYQKSPLPLPLSHDQPLALPLPPLPFPYPQVTSTPTPPPIQIHQSPLQQKQQQQQQKNHIPATSSSTSSQPTSTSSPQKSHATSSLQTQQPQRRNRLTTRPWERAILEDYYISFFCQSRHSRREKVKVDELVKKLGWEISRIQRWLDNRRTKDRPRFGQPEFGAAKGDEESDEEENNNNKKARHDDGESPVSSPSPTSSQPSTSSSSPASNSSAKTSPTNKSKGKNGKKVNKRKSINGNCDEDEPSLSSSPSPTTTPTPPSKKKKPLPPPLLSSTPPSSTPSSTPPSSTPPPPNPNQANTDFWVIKSK